MDLHRYKTGIFVELMKQLFFLILLFLQFSLSAQTISFDVFMFGDKIGTMNITRTLQADGGEHYVMETISRAKVLWIDRSNHTRYEVLYKNNALQWSNMKEVEDGKVKRWANAKWDGTKYNVESSKGKRSFSKVPTLSIVTMFFKEPPVGGTVFYEAEAEFNTLKSPEPGTYQFKGSDGQLNIYKFKNGKISDVEFHVSIATIKLVRTN